MCLQAGFVVTSLITLPMGYFNLDDIMWVQVVAFILTLACWAVWVAASLDSPEFKGNNSEWAIPTIPAVNDNPVAGSQAAVLGTILFNFGFVTTVPSWVNEKKPHVSVNRTVWISTFCCNLIFFVIGIIGCMAFRPYLQGPASNACEGYANGGQCAQSLMDVLTNPDHTPPNWSKENNHVLNTILQLSVYLLWHKKHVTKSTNSPLFWPVRAFQVSQQWHSEITAVFGSVSSRRCSPFS